MEKIKFATRLFLDNKASKLLDEKDQKTFKWIVLGSLLLALAITYYMQTLNAATQPSKLQATVYMVAMYCIYVFVIYQLLFFFLMPKGIQNKVVSKKKKKK